MALSNIHLVMFGDCNTSGTSGSSVPNELISLLQQDRNTYLLTNLGDAMNTSREGVAKALVPGQPADIALISFGLVDAWETSLPGIYISYFPDNIMKRRTRKLLKSFKKKLRKPLLRKCIPVGPVVSQQEFEVNLNRIFSTLKTRNPNIKFIFWGAVPVEDEPRNQNLYAYDAIMKRVAITNNGLFLDTRSTISQYSREEMFDDAVHLSKKANYIVAQALIPLIRSL